MNTRLHLIRILKAKILERAFRIGRVGRKKGTEVVEPRHAVKGTRGRVVVSNNVIERVTWRVKQ